ncbi:MAG: DUF2383 domain-containing protein [Luteolibacter sp.]
MKEKQNCISACNKLLRGEISAIETYQQALEKIDDSPRLAVLEEILEDHQKNTGALRNHISSMGGIPDTASGLWGNFARAVEGTAKLLGDSATITALKQGEEHGIDEYRTALNDPNVMAEAKVMFRDVLIPRLQKHVTQLERLTA